MSKRTLDSEKLFRRYGFPSVLIWLDRRITFRFDLPQDTYPNLLRFTVSAIPPILFVDHVPLADEVPIYLFAGQ